MDQEMQSLLEETKQVLENCKGLNEEIEEMDRCKKFLLDEYHTNKRWFKTGPGRLTTEDIIKSVFDFGWASRHNFDRIKKQNE